MNIERRLAAYRALALERLLDLLPTREPRRYLYDLVSEYPKRPSKGLRPALCIATCRAYGGMTEEAMPVAVALELLHNAFLVHDDIEDESVERRGRPTLHVEHGTALALNAGDSLVQLAYSSILAMMPRTRLTLLALDEIDEMVRQTIEGQALDLGWERDQADIDIDDYLRMIVKKTAFYTTICPVRLGALVGSNGRADVDSLFAYGAYLGAAFQVQNDLLDVIGDEPIGDDVRAGKRTLPLIHLLEHSDAPDREDVAAMVGSRSGLSAEDTNLVIKMMHAYGSIDFSMTCLHGLADGAHRAFDEGFADLPESEDLAFLAGLIDYIVDRVS